MSKHAWAAAALLGMGMASAMAGTVNAADAADGLPKPIHGAATITFSAPLAGQAMEVKTSGIVTGLGIESSAVDDPEIGVGEVLRATFSQGLVVTGIQLGLLFDGPEFSDVQESAQITATFAGGQSVSYTLTALYDSLFSWNGMGSVALLGGSNTESNGGIWQLTNPFGRSLVTQLDFTALAGTCGSGGCKNPSDYLVMSVTAVPEPATMALMAAGLGVVGWAARRRKAVQATADAATA
jgi:hypothetical protein